MPTAALPPRPLSNHVDGCPLCERRRDSVACYLHRSLDEWEWLYLVEEFSMVEPR